MLQARGSTDFAVERCELHVSYLFVFSPPTCNFRFEHLVHLKIVGKKKKKKRGTLTVRIEQNLFICLHFMLPQVGCDFQPL